MCIHAFIYFSYFNNLKISEAALSRSFYLIIAPKCDETMRLIVFSLIRIPGDLNN